MEQRRLRALVSSFVGVRVCVLGDIILDHFIRGRVSRISPEAPVPVVEMDSEELSLGGAGNVANNIASLGGDPYLISVTGQDNSGDRLVDVLRKRGLTDEGILRDPDRPTTVKSRIIAHQQQMIRVDREVRRSVGPEIEKQMIGALIRGVDGAQAIVLSDYAKGAVTRRIINRARRFDRIPLLIDPKVPNRDLYRGATIVTPNVGEASRMSGLEITDDETLRLAAHRIMRSLALPYLLVTRGEDGMTLFDHARRSETHIPSRAQEVYDVTGAGDTVVAALALAKAAGATWLEAATIANHAAGIVVSRIGTATVSTEELVESFRSP